MSSAPRYYTNGRVAKSATKEARHQGETPRGSRHPRKPQGSRAESGSRWVVELVEVELLFGSTSLRSKTPWHRIQWRALGKFPQHVRRGRPRRPPVSTSWVSSDASLPGESANAGGKCFRPAAEQRAATTAPRRKCLAAPFGSTTTCHEEPWSRHRLSGGTRLWEQPHRTGKGRRR